MSNPFTYGMALTREQKHISRKELAEALLNNARDHSRLVLFGERRVGKSSSIPLFLPPESVLRIDCLNVRSGPDFIDRAFNALASTQNYLPNFWEEFKSGIESYSISTSGIALQGSFKRDSLFALLRAFDRFGRTVNNATIFFDEFHEVSMFKPVEESKSLLGILRGEIQRHSKTAYVFAGSNRREMHAMFQGYGNPFYQSAFIHEVKPIPAVDMLTFLGENFRDGDRPISPDLATTILQIAGESPNDVQHLAHYVWNASSAGTPIEMATIRRGLNQLLDHEDRYLADRLSELSPLQERLLYLLACHCSASVTTKAFVMSLGAKSRSSVGKAAQTLCVGDEPFLYQEDMKYRFRDRYAYLGLVRRLVVRPTIINLLNLTDTPEINLSISNALVNRVYGTMVSNGSSSMSVTGMANAKVIHVSNTQTAENLNQGQST